LGEVLVRIRSNSKSFTGRGISTDVIEASALAYLHALNRKYIYFKLNGNVVHENELLNA